MARVVEQPKRSTAALDVVSTEALARFPDRCSAGPPSLQAVEKGGSDRNFFRVDFADGTRLIAVRYGTERAENALYASLAKLLACKGVPVPSVEAESPGWIWLEDLGTADLWSRRRAPWADRKALYEAAISSVAALHAVPLSVFEKAGIALSAPFDEALYSWEQEYFFENGLGRLLGMSTSSRDKLRQQLPLAELASELAALPRVPIHRDFQSQNVMIRDESPVFIDFQGMRAGLGAYDIASLLYDPYTDLSEEHRRELIGFYVEAGGQVPAGMDFAGLLARCGLQRLMQAMGAYGFLGLVKGKPAFLAHAVPAAKRLAALAANLPGFEALARPLISFVRP